METIKKFLREISPRGYQIRIYESCKSKNCLVILPTGTGKTLIALMLSIYVLEKNKGKILFLAPTRPLAEQHLNYFKKHLQMLVQMEIFTGKVPAEKRKELWQRADIIFSTPQCISNDLKNNLYNLDEVSLLIEDECHRCLKNYAYTFVAKKYKENTKSHILGLTASPGAEKAIIKKVAENLGIEAIEIRTRDSEDVKEYLQELKFETIKLAFPEEFDRIRQMLRKIYDKKVEELRTRKLLFLPATKKNLLDTQHRIMSAIASGNKHFNLLVGASACATAIKLQHALELLETQTLSSFQTYMQDLFDQANKNKSRAAKQLVKQPEFNQAYILATELLAKKIEHPKIEKTKELVKEEIKKNQKAKIIVFSQYRESVVKICRELNSLENIKARVFVGQAKKTSKGEDTGLSQKEQQEIIREFSLGRINILCATSVHPDEYIVLKKDNKITIKKIGEFVNLFIKKENLGKVISRKIGGWEALTSDGKKILFKPITRVHKHQTQNKVVKVGLGSGFDCMVTENHSLFSFNNKNNFIPAIAEQNKFIALALNCPNIEKDNKIDIIREICENCSKKERKNLFGSLQGLTQAKIRTLKTDFSILSTLKGNTSITNLSELSKKDYSTAMDCLNRLKENCYICQIRENRNYKNLSQITAKGRGYLKFLKWFFDNVEYKKGKYRFILKKIPKEDFNKFSKQDVNINYGKTKFPRFLEINESLARFLGFYVSEGSTRKTKSTSDVFLAARKRNMQDMMKESIENGLKLKPRVNWRGVAINSQIAYHLIKSVLRAGVGAYNKEVPEIIFTSPTNIKLEFLRAYFLGDGYLGKDKIVLTTVSRKLVTGLVLLLRMLGIKKVTLHKQKNIYRVNIYESLPFAKIKERTSKRGHAYYSLVPNAINSEKAFSIYKNYFKYLLDKRIKCRKNSSWKEDICFDYVKKIGKTENPKFVYDLSIQDTQNFVGGTGLFCLHNSIGEEGLDIPEVNAVIFYEPVPSAIRKIQRAGRTARLMKGKLIILITKNTRDESYYWAAFHKEKKMYQAIEGIKKDMENETIEGKQKTLP